MITSNNDAAVRVTTECVPRDRAELGKWYYWQICLHTLLTDFYGDKIVLRFLPPISVVPSLHKEPILVLLLHSSAWHPKPDMIYKPGEACWVFMVYHQKPSPGARSSAYQSRDDMNNTEMKSMTIHDCTL